MFIKILSRFSGDFNLGVNNLSNKGEMCSDIGRTAILSVEECESSVPWIQDLYPDIFTHVTQETVSGYPKGCYLFTQKGHSNYGVLFNKHRTGSPESLSRQVCKPEATGKLSKHSTKFNNFKVLFNLPWFCDQFKNNYLFILFQIESFGAI